MLRQSILATNSFYASYSHSDYILGKYFTSFEFAFSEIKKAIDSGHPETYLKGPVCQSGFKRLN